MRTRLTLREKLGLDDLRARTADARLALFGDPHLPKSRFSWSSLRQLMPLTGAQLWFGRNPYGRRTMIMNLFNHTPTPVEAGWSVEITQVRDFRGGNLTYDSHNGTDFAVPPGTLVAAAAAGRVVRIVNEYNRGGLKVVLDHGAGLVTSSNHLGRALVRVGDVVRRGEPIALSGYSGLDGLVTFPFGIPHVHYNVWLGGVAVDPFARPGEVALWLDGEDPRPRPRAEDEPVPANDWSETAIRDGIAACKDSAIRASLEAEDDLDRRGCALVFQYVTYPTRFTARPAPYAAPAVRAPRLALPFLPEEIDGVAFPSRTRRTSERTAAGR